eukprot:scaffold7829_cov16-Prasinocladus_malaysianus.AAC.1
MKNQHVMRLSNVPAINISTAVDTATQHYACAHSVGPNNENPTRGDECTNAYIAGQFGNSVTLVRSNLTIVCLIGRLVDCLANH